MNNELENESRKIDLAFELIKPIDYGKVFDHLKADMNKSIEAMREFTDRVESGEIRSKKTYKKFKEIVSNYDLKYKNHIENGKSSRTI